MIPNDLEDQGILGGIPADESVGVSITYWLEGASEPFYWFRAFVNRESVDVSVTNAENWRVLEDKTFANSQSL